jgi:hypothetical protein
VHHEVGVSEAKDPPNAYLLSQLEPMHQGLVFGDVVRRAEVDLQYILQLVPLGRGEYDAGSQAPSILVPSKFMRQYVESGADGRYWFSPSQQRNLLCSES